MAQKVARKETVSPAVHSANSTGIPTQMKLDFEQYSGLSFDDVRVQYHSDKPAAIGALAYTQGAQVYLGPGQEKHLRHELGHVIQQKLGVVQPDTALPKGRAMNTDPGLEREADALGSLTAGQVTGGFSLPLKGPVPPFRSTVIQAQRISQIQYPAGQPGPLPLPGGLPLLVFESMGTTGTSFDEIFNQTQAYACPTICVFGFNCPEGGTLQGAPAIQTVFTTIEGTSYPHISYTFAFTWKSLPDTYYKMPFVEARLLIMETANACLSLYTNVNPDSVFYRWIDGDAKDDQHDFLRDPQFLKKDNFSVRKSVIFTGSYDWRSELERIPGAYSGFIKAVNNAERALRIKYYALLQELGPKSYAIPKDTDLPGFYFPETALMMNNVAHQYIASIDARGIVGAEEKTPQDKESMKIVSTLERHLGGAENIRFVPLIQTLNATKPIKHEFSDSPGQVSYWGKDMVNFFRNPRSDETAFITALKNLRQSAFDPKMWYFVPKSTYSAWEQESPDVQAAATGKTGPAATENALKIRLQVQFNAERREQEKNLWNYLQTSFQQASGSRRRNTAYSEISDFFNKQYDAQSRAQALANPLPKKSGTAAPVPAKKRKK